MKRTLSAVGIAGILGVAAAAQQQSQQPQQQQQQSQQQKPSASAQGQQVTLTGCVYQATDQPTTFALQRMDNMSGSSASGTSGSTAGSSGATSGAASGASGTTGAAAGAREQGAWYRLSPSGTEDVKQYVGRPVRISGTVTPGKDEKGADVVVHRIEPGKVTITTLDLKPAPQLQIQSIAAAQGQCSQASGNR